MTQRQRWGAQAALVSAPPPRRVESREGAAVPALRLRKRVRLVLVGRQGVCTLSMSARAVGQRGAASELWSALIALNLVELSHRVE